MNTETEAAEAPSPHGQESIPIVMKAVTGRTYGTQDVLRIEELPIPEPGDDEVLIRVMASSLNALDWHFVTGTPYFMRLMVGLTRPKRIVPGSDVAGTVVAVGSAVDDLSVGDRVFGETNGGGCGEYLATKAASVARIPADVSFESAAATPVAGLTAIQALRTHAAVQPGDRVLINGAAGGVGTYAVQIARALGARVTAVCSTRNVEMVEAIGANRVVDYTREDFVADGRLYDVMMDNVGNRPPRDVISVLAPGARYVAVSGPKKNRLLGPVPHIARMALAFLRTDHSFHQFTASPNRQDLDLLAAMLADGRIAPQVQRVIGLDGVADAVGEIGTGHVRAKIVVKPVVAG